MFEGSLGYLEALLAAAANRYHFLLILVFLHFALL
jgi:hypothetical protein